LYGIHCPSPHEDLRRKLLGAKAIGGWKDGPVWPLYKLVPKLDKIDACDWDNKDTILAMCDKAKRTKLLEHFLKLFGDLEELASQVLGG